MLLIRIVAPHFTAACVLGTDECAPIIWYLRKWSIERVEEYCKRKGWELKRKEI